MADVSILATDRGVNLAQEIEALRGSTALHQTRPDQEIDR